MNTLRNFWQGFLDGLWVLQAIVRGKVLRQGEYIPRKHRVSLRLPLVATTGGRLLKLVYEWGYQIPDRAKLEVLLNKEIGEGSHWNTQHIFHFRFEGSWAIRQHSEIGLFQGKKISPIFFLEYEAESNPFGPPEVKTGKKEEKPCPKAPIPDALRREASAFRQSSSRGPIGSPHGFR